VSERNGLSVNRLQRSGTAHLVDGSARVNLISDSPDRLDTYVFYFFSYHYRNNGTWGGVVVKALRYYSEVSGSIPGGFTVDFFRSYRQDNVPWVDSSSKNEYQGFLLGLRRPVRNADDLPPSQYRTSRKSGALTYPETLGPSRPVLGDLYLYRNNSRVVSIVTRLWAGRSGVRIPVGPEDFSPFQKVQNGSGFYIQRIISRRGKAAGA
jgi:hypothetical protein